MLFDSNANLSTQSIRHLMDIAVGPNPAYVPEPPQIEWRQDVRQLWVGPNLARKVRSTKIGKNIVAIFNAFQEDGWPSRIDSPFTDDEDGKTRMRDAVQSANEGLSHIRFEADGSGIGICFHFCTPDTE